MNPGPEGKEVVNMENWNYEQMRSRITKLPTTAVSDALDAVGLRDNTVCGLFPTWDCGPVFGRAVTCCNIPASGHTQAVHGGFKVADFIEPGDVVMVGNGGDTANNGWGGLVSWGAKLKGAVGALVDGAARDVGEYEAMGFPVYARGLVCRTARGRMVQLSVNQPIRFGEAQVRPGDMIYADRNGICIIPPDKLLEVVRQAEIIDENEAAVIAQMKAGMSAVEASQKANYEDMLKPDGAERTGKV